MVKSTSTIPVDLSIPNIKAFYTTKNGGFSVGNFASLNLGLHVDDDPVAVLKNRLLLEDMIHKKIIFMDQTHSAIVKVVEKHDLADAKQMLDGKTPISLGVKADGVVCFDDDIAIAVLTADCLPLLLATEDGSAIAAVHCGWKGIYQNIAKNAVALIRERTQSSIKAYLGPCIGPKSFEVGADLKEKFLALDTAFSKAFTPKNNDKYLCSLASLCSMQLSKLGIDNITDSAIDTFDENNELFSYRKSHITGRIATVIYKSSTKF